MFHARKTAVAVAVAATLAGFVPHGGADATTHGAVRSLGLKPRPLSAQVLRRYRTATRVSAAALPASVDLTRYAPPAGDQGQVGSCVSWAVDYTAMGWWLRKNGVAGFPLAPMYTYSQLVNGQNVGTTFWDTFGIAKSQGVDTRADYTQGDYDYTHLPTTHERANAANWKLSGFTPMSPDRTSISTALAANKPVSIAIPVYYNFFFVGSTGDYAGPSGSFQGYHAITALGYDTYGLKIENSWGSYWGNQGFARLSWNFVTNYAVEAYSVDGITASKPTVTAVSPAISGPAGGGTITITGTNFASNSTVKFGTAAATVLAVNDAGTQITAMAPAHAAGAANVTVTAAGTSAASAGAAFKYVGAPTGLRASVVRGPAAGGTTVRITGTNLQNGVVSIDGTPVSTTAVAAGTQLTFVTPAHAAGAVALSVSAIGGTTAAGSFTYVDAPSTSGVSAPVAPAISGTNVTITGTNLTGATVTIAGRAARVISTDPSGTSLVVAFPAGVTVSPAVIVVTTAGGTTTTSWSWR